MRFLLDLSIELLEEWHEVMIANAWTFIPAAVFLMPVLLLGNPLRLFVVFRDHCFFDQIGGVAGFFLVACFGVTALWFLSADTQFKRILYDSFKATLSASVGAALAHRSKRA